MPAPSAARRPITLLIAALAASIAGCAPHVVQDTADPCTPPRRAFTALAADYMDLASTLPVPAPHATSLLFQRVNHLIGERDDDFDRLYAQTPSHDHLDRAAADEMAARLAAVRALAATWRDLEACRRTQAAARPGGLASQPARLRHEEDLRTLRRTEEATANWRRRYERLRERIAELTPSDANRASLASATQLQTFTATAQSYAQTVADARREADIHFRPD